MDPHGYMEGKVQMEAKDFCFFVEEDFEDGDTYAYFCPLDYFKENKTMSPEYHDDLDFMLPSSMDEIAENCYVTSKSAAEVIENLERLGFVRDEDFWNFMKSIDEVSF